MKTYISIVIIAVAILFAACNHSSGNKNESSPTEEISVVYTCKMHPEVKSDKPGKCPKCGMELVKAETPSTDSMAMPTDSI